MMNSTLTTGLNVIKQESIKCVAGIMNHENKNKTRTKHSESSCQQHAGAYVRNAPVFTCISCRGTAIHLRIHGEPLPLPCDWSPDPQLGQVQREPVGPHLRPTRGRHDRLPPPPPRGRRTTSDSELSKAARLRACVRPLVCQAARPLSRPSVRPAGRPHAVASSRSCHAQT